MTRKIVKRSTFLASHQLNESFCGGIHLAAIMQSWNMEVVRTVREPPCTALCSRQRQQEGRQKAANVIEGSTAVVSL